MGKAKDSASIRSRHFRELNLLSIFLGTQFEFPFFC